LKGITAAYFVFPIKVPGILEATAFFAQAARERCRSHREHVADYREADREKSRRLESLDCGVFQFIYFKTGFARDPVDHVGGNANPLDQNTFGPVTNFDFERVAMRPCFSSPLFCVLIRLTSRNGK
jgi:hypothetical protein